MKNLYIAINSFVKPYHIFLKSIYQTQGNAGETYYCKNSGDIYYCFVFVVSGKLSLKVPNSSKLSVSTNEAIFLLSNEIKSYVCEQDTTYFWIYFSYDGTRLPINMSFALDDPEETFNSLSECQILLNKQGEFSLIKANNIFCKYFLEGTDKLFGQIASSGTTNLAILDSIEYINENLFHLPTIEEIAAKFGMPMRRFREEFELSTGVTPSKYIKENKLMIAKNYLDNTNLTLKEIADLIEFSSPYYLSKCFKERFEITPKDYRSNKKVE
ncbi:MAG: helix-turn-helix transcriptional regulator [Bacilli bacterium]|nr:helix-turn-helix transcriptional regulator [Bacilli bacterium]MBO6280618.1 helix-turn-helix transcriptional regulator [Bacilli bacterium]